MWGAGSVSKLDCNMACGPLCANPCVQCCMNASAPPPPPSLPSPAPGATHSLVSVEVNRSTVEWLLAEFPATDLSNPKPTNRPDVLKVELYQSRDELEQLRDRFPREFGAAAVVAPEGATQRLIDAERARLAERRRVDRETPRAERKAVFFEDFRDYDEIMLYLELLLAEPSIEVRKVVSGQTREGRDIHTWYFTGSGGLVKPTVYLQGSAHANEWMGTMGCVYALTELIEGYAAGDQEIVQLMDALVFVATPVLNVDGYLHTWTATGRNWRKNRRDNGDGSFGVDLNRNNGPERTWCTAGSSTNPSSNTYCGPSVLSEPEDRSMGELLATIRETQPLLTAVDFHTCGSLLLWPWQYSYEQLPLPERTDFEVLGLAQEVAINAVNGGEWQSIQGVDLYPHSGGFIDFVWEEHGVLGYTYEGSSILGGCHVQPPEAILPSSAEQYAGVLEAARWAMRDIPPEK